MNPPPLIKVFAHTFEIRLCQDNQMHGNVGFCESAELKIDINGSLPRSIQRETLMHELFHAIAYSTNLKKDNDEERWINCLSMGFFTVLQDNPELKTYLLGA